MLLVGDPAYALPSAVRAGSGIDYQAALDVDGMVHAAPLAGQSVLLIQRFGGDGTYAVSGEFEDGEFMRLIVEFEPLDAGEVEE